MTAQLTCPQNCDAVLIAGPTASGKSALALKWAQEAGGVVINTDSMQVYDGLRILSARPGPADEAQVPHLLYGHVPVGERYSVGRFQADASAALAQAKAMGRLPVFVGGTGMYFAALTDGLAAIPPVPPAVQAQAAEKLAAIGVGALHGELMRLDPATAQGLRPSDPQRVLRAYAVFVATGRPLVEWQKDMMPPVLAGLRLARFVIDIPRTELRQRIASRFAAMVAAGAQAEADALRGLDPALPAAKTLGLREMWALTDGAMTAAEAEAAAVTATRQFAKRQVTWARGRMANWQWLCCS